MKPADRHLADVTGLLKPISTELEQVRRRIRQVLTNPSVPMGDFLTQIDIGGGKMLRPALALLAGRCLGELREEHIELAAIVEMIHLASLLHDDVIDQAQMRRGGRSANALWGNTQAVLLGDFVLSKAFGMGAALALPGAAAVLCRTAEAICTGEMMQNMQKGNRRLTEGEYLTIIEGKTASLFGACCQLGALAAGAEPAAQQAFREYGVALGLAFQMTDDLLDIFGDAAKEGKTLGGDLLNEKLTLPVIFWLGQDGGREKTLRNRIENNAFAALCQALQESGAFEYALRRAEDCARAARSALAEAPQSDAKRSLSGLVDYVLGRVSVCRPQRKVQ